MFVEDLRPRIFRLRGEGLIPAEILEDIEGEDEEESRV